MADIGGGSGGAGLIEGLGNVLGTLGERIDTHNQEQAKQRDLMADHLEKQAQEIGDNIMRVGGFDAPEAEPLKEQLKAVTERHNSLFPPHETPKLIKRLQKFIGHEPAKPQQDARAGMNVEDVMARARRPEFEKTPKGQKQQADVARDIGNEDFLNANELKKRQQDSDYQRAVQSGASEEELKQLRSLQMGIPATLIKPPAEKAGGWKVISGTLKNGEPFTYMHSETSNAISDMYGRPIEQGFLDGFRESPKNAPKPKQAFTVKNGKFVSVMLDANNQEIPGTANENVAVPASLTGRVTTGQYHWVDEDGNVHETEETRSSRPLPNGGVSGAPAATPPAGAPPPLPPAGTPSQTAPTVGSAPGVPAAAKPGAAPPKPGVAIPATPKEAKDRVLGQKGTPAQTKARETYDSAVGMDTKANLAWSKPSATNDKALVMALIKDTSGRFNMAEYDALVKGTGFANSMEGLLNKLTTGELPIGLRKQLVDAAHHNLAGAKAEFEAARRPAASVGASAPTDVDAEILRLLKGQ